MRTDCTKALEEGWSKAKQLSSKSLSRYFAERFLQSAETEASNGEYDGCVEYAEKAVDEVENRWHWLAPGETKKGRWMGRPVGIVFGSDGAMYVSDDAVGVVYRVTWQ